jgi:hypothetical protein
MACRLGASHLHRQPRHVNPKLQNHGGGEIMTEGRRSPLAVLTRCVSCSETQCTQRQSASPPASEGFPCSWTWTTAAPCASYCSPRCSPVRAAIRYRKLSNVITKTEPSQTPAPPNPLTGSPTVGGLVADTLVLITGCERVTIRNARRAAHVPQGHATKSCCSEVG